MTNPKPTDKEKTKTHQWLTMARRFLAFARGETERCKKRSCKSSGMCSAQTHNHPEHEDLCEASQSEDDAAQTIQLALFGMMLEEGLLNGEEESPTNSRHNSEIS